MVVVVVVECVFLAAPGGAWRRLAAPAAPGGTLRRLAASCGAWRQLRRLAATAPVRRLLQLRRLAAFLLGSQRNTTSKQASKQPNASNSVQFSSVQFSSVQFSSVQFNSVQFSSVQFSSVPSLCEKSHALVLNRPFCSGPVVLAMSPLP